jgi:SAM-dependent methyltransferase
MVANLTRFKDHATLLRAWRVVLDCLGPSEEQAVLLLAGRLDERAEAVKALAHDLDLGRSVRFLGFVPDVANLLHAADLGVHAAEFEGCPNGVLECMAAGLALAGTDTPGIREVVGPDGWAFLSPHEDAQALAARILQLLRYHELRNRLGEQNRRRVQTEYTVEAMGRRWAALIRDGLSRCSRPGWWRSLSVTVGLQPARRHGPRGSLGSTGLPFAKDPELDVRTMSQPEQLCCPRHRLALNWHAGQAERSVLACPSGCEFPVVKGIPRFVPPGGYAHSFGLQWNAYQRTQLDSYTGVPISRDRLVRCLGGCLEFVRGKSVLEAGCGAGRFTEVLLKEAAAVFALDLSAAVEANYANCAGHDNYFLCQADILQPPVLPHSFDVVVCLGVIQHTPSPEKTIHALAELVKPGGWLVIDHYAPSYPENASRRILRKLMLRLPGRVSLASIRLLSRLLIPVHRLLRPPHRVRGPGRLRNYLLRLSPIIDYYEQLPELPIPILERWMELDTHDALTDYYKHLRTREQIQVCLEGCGLVEIQVTYAGNGVEARARKPK